MKVVEAYEKKEGSMRKLAERFTVSLTFVFGIVSLWRKTGSVKKKPHGGGAHLKLTQEVKGYIKTLLEEKNDLTLKEMKHLLSERYGIHMSKTTVDKGIRELGWSRKKKRSITPKRTATKSKQNDSNTRKRRKK